MMRVLSRPRHGESLSSRGPFPRLVLRRLLDTTALDVLGEAERSPRENASFLCGGGRGLPNGVPAWGQFSIRSVLVARTWALSKEQFFLVVGSRLR